MKFEWDDAKDRSNQKKHGVSFAEAQRLFESSADYLEIFDAEHSEKENLLPQRYSTEASKA